MSISVEYLVVAGGASGGATGAGGGGGGAGGVLTATTNLSTQTNYTITLGAGGASWSSGAGYDSTKRPGSNSVFSGFTAIGGGGGSSDSDVGQNGGSGGGGGGGYATLGGLGTTGQGNNGGRGWAYSGVSYTGGGGGGAGGVGFAGGPTTATGGDGGIGIQSAITGVSLYYAGGGGGGGYTTGDPIGVGGLGGGGDGSNGSGPNPTPGTANTGGGGGGGAWGNTPSGAGGSGVIILKYPNTSTISNTGGGLTFTTATVGGFNVTTFTAGTGSIQFSEVLDPGLNAPTSVFNTDSIEIVYVDQTLPDNATVAYTITGVTSSDINGAALTGNFIMSAGVSYLTLTASIVVANKTLTISAGVTSVDISITKPPVAIGGVVTTVADSGVIYRAHTFTESGTLTIYTPGVFEYLMVAGGGGGGTDMGGGGGAGGYIAAQQVSLAAGTYDIVVGAGGNGAPQTAANANASGSNGSNTTFNGLTAIGGGGGASNHSNTISNAGNGGSGGGGSGGRMSSASYGGLAGTGTAGQGFNGAGSGVTWYPGGGGGAGAAASQTGSQQADGGIGILNDILGTAYYWAGGGAGAGYSTWGGNGGLGGGGGGAPRESASTANGTGGGSALNPGSNAVIGTLGAQTNVAGGAAGANTGGGGGGGSHYVGANQGGNGGSGIFIIRYLGPGMAASSNDLTSGETLTINLRTEDTADNTTIAYTITGVNSGDINGSALSGNFTMVDNTASVSFLITTTAKKTLVFTSNGFTETVALIENRYGLAFLPGDNNQSFTSISYPQLVDISDRYDLTDISILSSIEQFEFSTQPIELVTSYTASDAANIIDLSTSTADLLNITILQTNDLYKHDARSGDSVLVDNKILYSPDLVSIALFNVPEPIPLTFPERWAG